MILLFNIIHIFQINVFHHGLFYIKHSHKLRVIFLMLLLLFFILLLLFFVGFFSDRKSERNAGLLDRTMKKNCMLQGCVAYTLMG